MLKKSKIEKKKKIKVWLDCDPGHDDSMAILLACYGKDLSETRSIQLLGISTVHGNATVENTTRNALRMTTLLQVEVDVVQGQSTPLMRPSQICPEIHGESGLDLKPVDDGPIYQWPSLIRTEVDKKAVIHMYDIISRRNDGEVTLVVTGCHTNVALLLTLFPEVKSKLDRIVILGGAIGIGNMTPSSEFNILLDPEASKIVFEAGVPLFMIPIEISHQALVTKNFLSRIQNLNSSFGTLLLQLLTFFADTYDKVFKMPEPPLHDPLTIAFLLEPSLFEFQLMRVDIETSSELCRGRTSCDLYQMNLSKPKNCFVCTKANLEPFWEMLFKAAERANLKISN